ncbi:hypothetical protein BHM03_00015737 [Ensete ventricosum]|nr:hypothetical protein BHM03_00015737 [Ensete ventricosum]
MRFTDSPVVELPAGGAVLTFEQDNGSMHVVWPCSLIRLKFVERWLSRPPYLTPTLTFSAPRQARRRPRLRLRPRSRCCADRHRPRDARPPPQLKRNRPVLPRAPKHA